jgi:hypothetical protein
MGDGWIFLKTRCDVSFKKGLSNDPTFGLLIHLAGQYPKVAEFSDTNMVHIEVFICIVIIRIDILLNHTDIYLHLIISFYTFSDIYVCVYVL